MTDNRWRDTDIELDDPAAELERRRWSDPLLMGLKYGEEGLGPEKNIRGYAPSPTARLYHASNAYYRLVTGGGRAGKTSAVLADLALTLRGIHPFKPWQGPFTAIMFCVSRQQAAMVAQKKLFQQCELPGPMGQFPFIPQNEIAEIGSLKAGIRAVYHCLLTNGCQLYFSWSDTDDTWKRIQGPKIGRVVMDENAGNAKLLIESYKRLVDSQHPGSWHGLLDWSAHGTEDNEAFEKFKSRCLDPDNKDHELFTLKLEENPAIDMTAVERFRDTLTEDEQAIHIDATESAGGLVRIFRQQFRRDRHVLPTDYKIKPDDNLYVGYDPGVDHPMGMMVFAIAKAYPRTLIHCKLWMRRGGTIDDDVAALAQWLGGRAVAGFVYDTNLKNRDRGGGPSLLTQFKEKALQAGITVHGYWQSKKNHAPGIAMMRHYFKPDQSETTLPLIYISPSTQSGGDTFISEVIGYRGKEATKFTGPGGIVKKNDASLDCFRYVCMVRPTWAESLTCGQVNPMLAGSDSLASQDAESIAPVVSLTPQQAEYQRTLKLSALAAQRRSRRHKVYGVQWG